MDWQEDLHHPEEMTTNTEVRYSEQSKYARAAIDDVTARMPWARKEVELRWFVSQGVSGKTCLGHQGPRLV